MGVGEEVGEGGVKGKDLKADALRSDIRMSSCHLSEDETYLEHRRSDCSYIVGTCR